MQLSNQYSGVNLFALEPTLHYEEEDDEDDEDDDYLTDGWYSFKRWEYLSVKELQNHNQALLWHWLWALLSIDASIFSDTIFCTPLLQSEQFCLSPNVW